jgi:hypothetical protein
MFLDPPPAGIGASAAADAADASAGLLTPI